MGLLRRKPYDRRDSLTAAATARGKGHTARAIAEYEKVLEHEPENAMILAKLAELLAKTKRGEEARARFGEAALVYEQEGFNDKAIAVLSNAAVYFPADAALWENVARLERYRGRPRDAVRALLAGTQHVRSPRRRPDAIRLLRQVLQIDADHLEATIDLARLLGKEGDRDEARRLLESLAGRSSNPALSRVRRALFFLSPTPGAAWRWLRALSGRP